MKIESSCKSTAVDAAWTPNQAHCWHLSRSGPVFSHICSPRCVSCEQRPYLLCSSLLASSWLPLKVAVMRKNWGWTQAEWEKHSFSMACKTQTRTFSLTKQTLFIVGSRVFIKSENIWTHWVVLFCLDTVLPPLWSFSSVRRSLLRAVWCHPFPGVARLLQRLAQLWVGYWGWARKLHQDQLWQVCETVLELLSCGKERHRPGWHWLFLCVRASPLLYCITQPQSQSLYLHRHIYVLCSENNPRWLRFEAALCQF